MCNRITVNTIGFFGYYMDEALDGLGVVDRCWKDVCDIVTVDAIGFPGEYIGETFDGLGINDRYQIYLCNSITVNTNGFAGEYMGETLDSRGVDNQYQKYMCITVNAIGFVGNYMYEMLEALGVDDRCRKYMCNRLAVNAIGFVGDYMRETLDGLGVDDRCRKYLATTQIQHFTPRDTSPKFTGTYLSLCPCFAVSSRSVIANPLRAPVWPRPRYSTILPETFFDCLAKFCGAKLSQTIKKSLQKPSRKRAVRFAGAIRQSGLTTA